MNPVPMTAADNGRAPCSTNVAGSLLFTHVSVLPAGNARAPAG